MRIDNNNLIVTYLESSPEQYTQPINNVGE